MTTSMLGDAIGHHLWATQQLLDLCADLSDEQLATPVVGTYGPMMETLRHLVHSDHWYLSFFRDVPEISDDDANAMRLEDLRRVFATDATTWLDVVANETDPNREIVERDEAWVLRSPVGVRLAQVLHHGSDHRSQIATALTSIGREPPEFDVWAYARAVGREHGEPVAPET